MFCEKCGSPLPLAAQYCTRCGKQLMARMQFASPSRNPVQEHIRLLGILWMALSAVNVLGGGALLIVANTFFARWNRFRAEVHSTFLQPLLSFIGILILVKAAAGFLAGYGLLQREAWARILVLILDSYPSSMCRLVPRWGSTLSGCCCRQHPTRNTGPSRGLRREAIFIAGIGRSPLESSQGRRSSVGRAADS